MTNRNEVNARSIAQFNRVIAAKQARLTQVEAMNCSNKNRLIWEAKTLLERAVAGKAKFLKMIALEEETGMVN